MLGAGDTEVSERTERAQIIKKINKPVLDFKNTGLLYKCNIYPNIPFEIKCNPNLSN